jgi:hypothetical protein
MLDYFSSWNVVMRQQRALLRAFARWQNNPGRDLGTFGLSVTTEITNPRSSSVTVQFTLHHSGGGALHSGLVSFDYESTDWDFAWLAEIASPLLREFLLPSAIAGEFRAPADAPASLREVTA